MEIKIRIWDTNENRMVYNAQNTYDYGCRGIPIWEDSFQDVNENDTYIKMLYTNIKDKNGNEIYEGDIVYYSTLETYLQVKHGEVSMLGYGSYKPLINCFFIEYLNEEYEFLNRKIAQSIKVVGNIYEDINLLK